MVLRNEGKTLKRILNTCKSLIDEIVIFNQDSTDNTVEIAKSFGAIVIDSTRKGLADIDRQDCYNFATKDMIFVLDGDELPDKKLNTYIKNIKMNGSNYDVFWFMFNNTVDGVDIKEALGDDWHPRLWVNRQPPVVQWPQVAHTFPNITSTSQIFCDPKVVGTINHIRTMKKIRFVTQDRVQAIDPMNAQKEAMFLDVVDSILQKS